MDRPSGVTMLSDLPSLDDIQGEQQNFPTGRGNAPSARDMAPESAMKFVRQNYVPPMESGMRRSNEGYATYGSYGSKQPGMYAQGQYDQWNNGEYQTVEGFNPQPFRPNNGELMEGYPNDVPGNCVDTSYHVKNCPICSQLYKNDKGIYIISIVVLVIICVILLKKVLNL